MTVLGVTLSCIDRDLQMIWSPSECQPWWWTRYISPNGCYILTSLRGVNPQKNVILAVVSTSNLRRYGRPCFRHDPASKSPGDIIRNTTDIIIYIFTVGIVSLVFTAVLLCNSLP
jgi:hypothetical protein